MSTESVYLYSSMTILTVLYGLDTLRHQQKQEFVFNCTVRPPTTWCLEGTEMMRIQIKAQTNVTSTENVKFRMTVFGKLVTNYVLILSGSTGGSVGGLILIYTAVKLFLYIRKNTRY
ncbi:uncharacterized protein LOC134267497 isoform X2 [Saccostrea cucullata]|uniref:uncharacterized protein LOC134267497 isoform X2 n=1 Tax=Saccostrea cuccullata TaxID=36930 RepID=UPI002ED0DD99